MALNKNEISTKMEPIFKQLYSLNRRPNQMWPTATAESNDRFLSLSVRNYHEETKGKVFSIQYAAAETRIRCHTAIRRLCENEHYEKKPMVCMPHFLRSIPAGIIIMFNGSKTSALVTGEPAI